jgi:peptidyl-prolyl cis-trans isomerase A (cyclophilin A)/peptidyl-prolyl cis-trans isomerase B (cyclophilin B)
MRIRRSFLHLTFALSLIAVMISGCGSGGGDPPAASIGGDSTNASGAGSQSKPTVTEPVQVRAGVASSNTPAQPPQTAPDPEVILKTSLGDIRLRLNAGKAPLTVDNFLSNYVERGFYEGTVFHYVDKGFMVAAGGYTTELEPKATRAYVKSEASNGLKNKRGTIAMARNPDHADSATSQFFINLADNPSLDPRGEESPEARGYCVFGEVVEGMDVIDRIAGVEVADRGQFPKTPVAPVQIQAAEWIR